MRFSSNVFSPSTDWDGKKKKVYTFYSVCNAMLCYIICIYTYIYVFREECYLLILSGLERVRSESSATHGSQWSILWTAPQYDYLGNVGGVCVCAFLIQDGNKVVKWSGHSLLCLPWSHGQCTQTTYLVTTCPAGILHGNLESSSIHSCSELCNLDSWSLHSCSELRGSLWLDQPEFASTGTGNSERPSCLHLAPWPGALASSLQMCQRWPYTSPKGDPL